MPTSSPERFRLVFGAIITALGIVCMGVVWQSYQITANGRAITVLARERDESVEELRAVRQEAAALEQNVKAMRAEHARLFCEMRRLEQR